MNEPGPVAMDRQRQSRHVFVSYATADRKEALRLTKAIERRGIKCWISTRDVEPGGNYQEAIVRAIRDARALVLVFSTAANSSDEIKKELSLSSRYRVPVLAVRIANVEPSDAFAYELSTRQWIDAFEGWEHSIDALSSRLTQIPSIPQNVEYDANAGQPQVRFRLPQFAIAAAASIALVLIAGTWFRLKPAQAAPQGLQVRLAGFERLSNTLPATLPEAMRNEVIAAFGNDGIVRVSTATSAPPGSEPAYALDGTVGSDDGNIQVIARLFNERTGTVVWSNSSSFAAAKRPRVPRLAAIDVSIVVRCGLFGASTYPRSLPESAFADYFQFCENRGVEPDKALDFARKVVAAVPDFSWGWSAVEIAAFDALLQRPPPSPDRVTELRQEALAAADKAISLDKTNSEALAYKSYLIDDTDLIAREKLLKQAVLARTLPCGCEHHFYGDFLVEVGRLRDAIPEYRRSVDILALNPDTQLTLAQLLVATGRPDLAKEHIEVARELDDDPRLAGQFEVTMALSTGDFSRAIKALNDPIGGAPPPIRRTLTIAFEALRSNNSEAKRAAILGLEAMPPQAHGRTYATLLAALGANREALDSIVEAVSDPGRRGARSWLFSSAFANVLRYPSFPAVAQKLGLIPYWKTSGTKPDVCQSAPAPDFCKLI